MVLKESLVGKYFIKFRTKCKVINYDFNSGKYIYKILADGNLGYVSKEEILENLCEVL